RNFAPADPNVRGARSHGPRTAAGRDCAGDRWRAACCVAPHLRAHLRLRPCNTPDITLRSGAPWETHSLAVTRAVGVHSSRKDWRQELPAQGFPFSLRTIPSSRAMSIIVAV